MSNQDITVTQQSDLIQTHKNRHRTVFFTPKSDFILHCYYLMLLKYSLCYACPHPAAPEENQKVFLAQLRVVCLKGRCTHSVHLDLVVGRSTVDGKKKVHLNTLKDKGKGF